MIESGFYNAESGKVLFDKVIPTMLSDLSPVVVSLIVVLVLAASMSTLSSLVLTSSSTLTLDVIKPAILKKKGEISEKKSVLIMRIFIVFFIAVSAIIAIFKDSIWSESVFIAQMMGVSWGALAGAFLAPFLYGLYWKKATKASVVVSFIFGTGLEIIQLLISKGIFSPSTPALSFVFQNSLTSGVFAMVGGLILVPVVSLMTQKTLPENVDEKFSCYNATVTTIVTNSLG
jgi:SSS family solute:Na+ symporter